MEYLVKVWLNIKVSKDFKYNGTVYSITNEPKNGDSLYTDIAANSEAIYGTGSWENDMINAVLDGFKGTDMNMIDRIEY